MVSEVSLHLCPATVSKEFFEWQEEDGSGRENERGEGEREKRIGSREKRRRRRERRRRRRVGGGTGIETG